MLILKEKSIFKSLKKVKAENLIRTQRMCSNMSMHSFFPFSQRVRNASDLLIFGRILEAFQITILFNIPTNSSIKKFK